MELHSRKEKLNMFVIYLKVADIRNDASSGITRCHALLKLDLLELGFFLLSYFVGFADEKVGNLLKLG